MVSQCVQGYDHSLMEPPFLLPFSSHTGGNVSALRPHQVSFYFIALSNVLPEKEAGHREIRSPFRAVLEPMEVPLPIATSRSLLEY